MGMETEFETLLYREENGVAYVTLNRPDVQNSFDYTMIDELAALWQGLRSHDPVRCVVLTGAGDRAFCTGNDRSTIPFDVKWDPYTYDDPGLTIGPRVNRMWKPVIAAVNGTAAAGAFYLLGQVDFIIAADHATFVEPHVTYAMPAVYEPIEALAKMPFGEAMRMALLGTHERMSAKRAHEIGFVTEVVPLAELMDAATWAAEAIAAQPPAAIQSTLRTLWAARDMFPSQATALGNTFLHLGMDADKENLKEGEEAFANRPRTKPRVQLNRGSVSYCCASCTSARSSLHRVGRHHRPRRHDGELGDGELRVREQHGDELGDGATEVVGLHVVLVDHARGQPLREQRAGVLGVEVAGEVGAERVADRHAHEPLVGALHAPRPHRAVERGLARAVGREAVVTAADRDRRQEDDRTVLGDVVERGLRHQRRRDGVGGDDVLPRVGATPRRAAPAVTPRWRTPSASIPPMASTASPTMPEQRSGSRTSAAMPVPLPAVATTSFSLSSLRPTTVMSAPALAAAMRGAAPDARRAADDQQLLARQVDVDAHERRPR